MLERCNLCPGSTTRRNFDATPWMATFSKNKRSCGTCPTALRSNELKAELLTELPCSQRRANQWNALCEAHSAVHIAGSNMHKFCRNKPRPDEGFIGECANLIGEYLFGHWKMNRPISTNHIKRKTGRSRNGDFLFFLQAQKYGLDLELAPRLGVGRGVKSQPTRPGRHPARIAATARCPGRRAT